MSSFYFERTFGVHVHDVDDDEITEHMKSAKNMRVEVRFLGRCRSCLEILYATPWQWSFFNT